MSGRVTKSLEDYLECIYQTEHVRGYARIKEVAERLGVKPASASEAIGRLRSLGLVEHDRYGIIRLTPRGRNLAKKVLEKHLLLTEFLHNVLGLDEEKAEEEACKIEHFISQETLERLIRFIKILKERYPDLYGGGTLSENRLSQKSGTEEL